MSLPGDPHLAPGVSQSDLDGMPCRQCGECGCECEDDGDPRSYRERMEEEKGEHQADLEREGS
jgi:hypothetical protein